MRLYSPAEVERITGIPQVTIRDWRRRGILTKSIGVERAGRWKYRDFDLVHIAVTKLVAGSFLDLKYAFYVAADVHFITVARIREGNPLKGYDAGTTYRYACFWPGQTDDLGMEGFWGQDNLLNDENFLKRADGRPLSLVVDIDLVIAALPAELVTLIKTDFEGYIAGEDAT